ncbi:hypothetical protein GCM10023144_31290 [Pigmentiphaga soli]|uniref:GlsB/YeaQ/YmgE family stress response membrane protein n=1 Tax=Pigmentiphaga soli TaxID=1007095 RepID=A0ABP8HBH9_9BURK
MVWITEALALGLIAGGLGAHLFAKLFPQFSLGMVGTTIVGVAGGGALSHLLFSTMPLVENASDKLSFPGAITHVVVGGIGGALLTAIIGKFKPRTA